MSPPIHTLTSSQGAVFLINSRLGFFSCGPHCCGQALLLTYGRYFAEFLEDHSPVRLGLLDLTTCVGLWYGLIINNLRNFSWKRALLHLFWRTRKFLLSLDVVYHDQSPDFPGNHPHPTNINPIICATYYPPSFHRIITRSRNINRVSIGSDFRHPLRPD